MENPFLESVQSPVEYRVTWAGSVGMWKVYDTATKETFKMSEISFIPLDILNTVKGWHGTGDSGSGIYSNEIRNTKTQEFIVRYGDGILCQGLWNDIKFEVKAKGGKWANTVYALLIGKTGNKLCTVTFVGSSIGPWIDEKGRKGAHMYKCGKNPDIFGKTEKDDGYYKPTVQLLPITADQKQEAIVAYQPLHEFLQSRKTESVESEQVDSKLVIPAPPLKEPVFETDNDNDDLPF